MSMPTFEKSPPALVERFRTLTADIEAVEQRQMFGYPCVFVGGNLVTGLHKTVWFVKVDPADRQALLAMPGAGPLEVMPGRSMGDYVVLPARVVEDDTALRGWLARSIAFGRTLPPKAAKATKTRGRARSS